MFYRKKKRGEPRLRLLSIFVAAMMIAIAFVIRLQPHRAELQLDLYYYCQANTLLVDEDISQLWSIRNFDNVDVQLEYRIKQDTHCDSGVCTEMLLEVISLQITEDIYVWNGTESVWIGRIIDRYQWERPL